MAWALLDDNFPFHPKVLEANRLHSLSGYLFACGLCYCRKYRTSGFISHAAVKALGLASSPTKPTHALVVSRLWDAVDGGYQVHGYLEQYDDAHELETRDERRQQKREAGRKGGLARAVAQSKNPQANFQAESKQPCSSTFQAHRDGLVKAPDRNDLVLSKKKEIGPRDAWWLELLRRYPPNRKRDSRVVQGEFNDVFEQDSRADAVIWAEIVDGLENALQGYEWRVKGMVPAMDKWLERRGWTERHEAAPVSAVVSDKTARTLTSLAEFVKDGQR